MIVEDIYEDIQELLGTCSQKKLFSRLTDAITILGNKGNFDLKTGYVDICAQSDGRTVTLPREIETPLAVNINGQPVYFRNKWFEFHLNGPGSNCPESPWSWDDRGYFPTFMDIIRPSRVFAICDLKTDLSAQIRVMGLDATGHDIRTQDPDGTWQRGMLVPVNLFADFPFGIPVPPDSREFIRNVKSVDMTELLSSTPHQIATGAGVTVTLLAGTMPPPLLPNITYFARKVSDAVISLYATLSSALTGEGAIVMTSADPTTILSIRDQRQVIVQSKFQSTIPHRLTTGKAIRFQGSPVPSPFIADQQYFARVIDATNFTAHLTADDAFDNLNPIDATDTGTAVSVLADQAIKPETWLDFSVNHNLLQGDAITISNETGAPPEPLINGNTYYARTLSATRITLHNSLADATTGTDPIAMTSGGSGSTSVVKRLPALAVNGAVNNIQCVNHNLSLAGGDLVRFETTGIFPSPLLANTAYRAEPPDSADSFTVNDLVPTPITITDPGTGQLLVVISRIFSIGFNSAWQTDATNISSGDPIKLKTTGSFPTSVPAISSLTTYFARKLTDGRVEIYDTAFNAGNAPSLVGRITVTGVGGGEQFLVLQRVVVPVPASNLLRVSPALYIENGALAQFQTSGALPPNLNILTNYKLTLENGFLRVKDVFDVDVPIVALGSGAHTMNIVRSFTINIPTSIEITSNNYNDGNSVTFRTTGTLPVPLALATIYFIRRLDDNHVELYATKAQAQAFPSTVGRITLLDTGMGSHTAVQLLPPILVARVDRVSKSETQGFIKFFAWDNGRTDAMTLIGDYFPDETEPSYRRIKVQNPCAWIRMRFDRKLYKITSVKDWIPLKSKMAILMTIRALELYRKEFSDRGAAMEAVGEKWANEEQANSDGPDQVQIQINSDIFTNPDAQSMDSYEGYGQWG